MCNRVEPVFSDDFFSRILATGILNDIPIGRVPKNKLRAFLNFIIDKVEPPVQVIAVAFNSQVFRYVFRSSGPSHVVAYFPDVKLFDKVLNELRGTISTVAAPSASSTVGVRYNRYQISASPYRVSP